MAQAGGGVAAIEHQADWMNMSPVTLNHFENMYKRVAETYGLAGGNAGSFERLLKLCPDLPAEAQDALKNGHKSAVETVMMYLRSPAASILSPVVENDLSYPMSNYFVSTSHNTYLTGNQLSSDSSIDAYRNVLLRGCRSVEVDVWDGEPLDESGEASSSGKLHGLLGHLHLGKHSSGEDEFNSSTQSPQGSEELRLPTPWSSSKHAEPRVLHGHTLTKEISFRSVCEVIGSSAFVNSDLPVIVSLEVHASPQQQELMVKIMRQVWGNMLVDSPLRNDEMNDKLTLPCPADLKHRILVKVKYTPPEKAKKSKLQSTGSTTSVRSSSVSSASSDDDNEPARSGKPKKRKMIEDLTQLGVYARSYHFKSFNQPEAKYPTHVFSLSESDLLEAQETSAQIILNHNKDFMMRAYPKSLRVSSSNLNPPLFWRLGVQSVALNWQDCDKGVMLNEGMFAGSGGWVLKPPSHRSNSSPAHTAAAQSLAGSGHSVSNNAKLSSTAYRNLDFSIDIFFAQNLPTPPGLGRRTFRPCVRSTLHVETLEQMNTAAHKTSRTNRFLNRLSDHITSSQHKDVPADSEKAQLKGRTRPYYGTSPEFVNERITFRDVCIDERSLCFLRLKVVDDVELGVDELAGWACIRLDRLMLGLRTVRLFDAKGQLSEGFLVVNIGVRESGGRA